jgi:hypothetical protein
MAMLSYEQTVAAAGLSNSQRVSWFAAGGNVTRKRGGRKWKAET